jgi:hypothetical protein
LAGVHLGCAQTGRLAPKRRLPTGRGRDGLPVAIAQQGAELSHSCRLFGDPILVNWRSVESVILLIE